VFYQHLNFSAHESRAVRVWKFRALQGAAQAGSHDLAHRMTTTGSLVSEVKRRGKISDQTNKQKV
jgi:hypothetical protein